MFCKYSHEKENQVIEINGNSCDFRQRLEEKDLHISNLENQLLLLENDQNETIEKLTTKIMSGVEVRRICFWGQPIYQSFDQWQGYF